MNSQEKALFQISYYHQRECEKQKNVMEKRRREFCLRENTLQVGTMFMDRRTNRLV